LDFALGAVRQPTRHAPEHRGGKRRLPLRGDKLRLAIEAPARAFRVYFEPVLVERLLHDVADEPARCRCCKG